MYLLQKREYDIDNQDKETEEGDKIASHKPTEEEPIESMLFIGFPIAHRTHPKFDCHVFGLVINKLTHRLP